MNYSALSAQSAALLNEFGQDVVIARSGTNLGTVAGIFTTKKQSLSDKSTVAQVVTAEHTMLIASTIAVRVGDTATVDGRKYKIQTVEPIAPSSIVMAYKIGIV